MVTSPSNIIEGLILILKANLSDINTLIRNYRRSDSLHLYKGLRHTLADAKLPALEMEPVSGSMEWTHIGAMTCEYLIDYILTVASGTNNEIGAEYICELTRKIIQIYNYPQNISWQVPNEVHDKLGTPVLCQYSDIRSVDYSSVKIE